MGNRTVVLKLILQNILYSFVFSQRKKLIQILGELSL